jgi:hypothetical protein
MTSFLSFPFESKSPELKHQARWSGKPWQPGEIPAMYTGTNMTVHGRHDDPGKPYGEFLGVSKPDQVGKSWRTLRTTVDGYEGEESKK